jgi:hypothetical protein
MSCGDPCISSLQAGEVNVQIQCFPYCLPIPVTPPNLGGATCILEVRSPYDVLSTLSLLVSGDGTYAYRLTLATDFPVGGTYNLQLIATFTDGTILKSPVQSLDVGWSLV